MKIKHVYGNVLKLDIPLTIKIRTIEDGEPSEREEPFYPDATKGCIVELANNYNRKIEYVATIKDNIAHIEDNGKISIGQYKLTVKCYDADGNPYRYMVRDIVEICDATVDAGIEAGVEFNAETYTLDGAVFIAYGGGSFEQEQADWTETDINSKAYIKNKPTNIVQDENYVHTDNNYTDAEKAKLADLENYDDSRIRQELEGKVDKVDGKGLSTNDFTTEEKTKLANAITEEQDPTVPSWAKQQTKPNYNAQEVGALPNSTKYGSTIDLTMDSTTYVLTLSLKDQDGTVLNTKTVDLPIESVVVNGRYDAINKKIVLTLQSGSTIDVPVGDLVAGLQTEITSVNMLDADLVDDTNSSHKFVTEQEKQNWNNKSDFSGSYNDLSDKPTIPSTLSQLSEDATHRTVSDAEKTTWGNKQDALVSGTNIKTINNQSIIGSGNITIQGGGGDSQVQSDWEQSDNTAVDYIKNKPTIPTIPTNVSAFNNDAGYYVKPVSGVPKSDFSSSVQSSLDKADTAVQTETDPTVPAWAKAENKPTYIADEINDTSTTNKFVTAQEKTTWNNKSDFSGNYNDLTNKPTIPTVPTNVSAFNNDAGYLTQHQDISGKENVTTIVAPVNATDSTLPITTLTTEVGEYYRIDVPVETLAVILPAMTDLTTVRTVVIYLTGGTTPAVTISSADAKNVYYQDGFGLAAGKTYEVNCLWNGSAWIVASVEIVVANNGGE